MFIGHFGIAFAAKKIAPRVSLGTLFLSAQLVDLLWPLMLLLGIEHVRIAPGITAVTPLDFYDYPITHSLVGFLGWAFLSGSAFFAVTRRKWDAGVIAVLVLSHWILDVITHRPDLPLAPGSDIVMGFGLWNSLWATMVVEGMIFCLGAYLYIRTTVASGRTGTIALWALIIFLLVVWFGNLFGPPPPDPGSIAVFGNATWLIVLWAYWINSKRPAISAT